MKIDIHVHTKKVKSGDAATRNIDTSTFADIYKNSGVKILAITNHNHFDKKQYVDFSKAVESIGQVWPGVELDVTANGKRGHLIVIVNPKNTAQFESVVRSVMGNVSADDFIISLDDVVATFDKLDAVYIAHYHSKKPNLGDEDIAYLGTLVSNPRRIMKEASNSISAGIYVSHGHNSIYGSDVQDWNSYVAKSKDLPELRLPVESFEQFCLLLEKDEATINTLLSKKIKETIELVPFSVAELIRLDIYNDINILFGSKGTGKTEILEALSRYFNAKGHKTTVYKSNDYHLNEIFDLKGSTLQINLKSFNVEDCSDEIIFIKEVTEVEVTSLHKYLQHFSSNAKSKTAPKIKIKDSIKEDEAKPNRRLKEVDKLLTDFEKFEQYLKGNGVADYVDQALLKELMQVMRKVVVQLKTKMEDHFFEAKNIKLLNGLIELFKTEIAKKTGQPKKPSKTGFADYGSNRIKIERALTKILFNINKEIEPTINYAGSLGTKGELYLQTNFVIQNGTLVNSNYSPAKGGIKKNPQKEFVKSIYSISKYVYSTELFEKIAELNQIDRIETINGVGDLLQFYRHFTLDKQEYSPSNGESSMVLLHKELLEDKEIYLIDEPEKSLGNDYINDVIVPLLKEKALLGKKVVIATHDANIAVRTLPYNSMYRLHDKKQYFTLTGNPFSNKLKCIHSSRPDLDWKEVSMRTLEGGKDAFGERGKIYGN